VDKIHNGLIGRAYFAKAWYTNQRKSIGFGKPAPVPSTLDWDLWQGPAPRRPYTDNIQPYNWHWFKFYGTGETLNTTGAVNMRRDGRRTFEFLFHVFRLKKPVSPPDQLATIGDDYAPNIASNIHFRRRSGTGRTCCADTRLRSGIPIQGWRYL
jgi:hypothetical protein